MTNLDSSANRVPIGLGSFPLRNNRAAQVDENKWESCKHDVLPCSTKKSPCPKYSPGWLSQDPCPSSSRLDSQSLYTHNHPFATVHTNDKVFDPAPRALNPIHFDGSVTSLGDGVYNILVLAVDVPLAWLQLSDLSPALSTNQFPKLV